MTIFHAKTINRRFSGNISVSSATPVDLSDGAGGLFQITIAKAAGTSLLVMASTACRATSSSSSFDLGVHDGSTDYTIGRTFALVTGSRRTTVQGAVMIPASGAGSVTLTLRGTKSSGTSVSLTVNESVTMTVIECGDGYMNAACASAVGNSQSTSSTSYIDVLDSGASPITCSLTKRDAGNKIIANLRLSAAGSSAVGTGGVHDGTIDTDVTSARVGTGSFWTNMSGEKYLTGHPAGLITCKPRIKTAAGTVTLANSVSLVLMEVPP